jgi:hypothetical protein
MLDQSHLMCKVMLAPRQLNGAAEHLSASHLRLFGIQRLWSRAKLMRHLG